MSIGFIGSLLSGVLGVAFLATALGSSNTAAIIKQFFDGFAGSVRSAMGR